MPQLNLSCQTCQAIDVCNTHYPPALGPLTLTFAQVRQNLAVSLPGQVVEGTGPLAAWLPNGDLGTLVLESWAYIGDILGLYGSVIATESYLQAAHQRRSQRRITALLGYRPRPAVGTSLVVAIHVEVMAATLDRIELRAPVPDSLPQAFTSTAGAPVSRRFNEFVISPQLSTDASTGENNTHLLELATAAPVRGRPVAFLWRDKVVKALAAEIVDISTVRQIDGNDYVLMTITEKLRFDGSMVNLEDVSLQSPSQRDYACTNMFDLPDARPIMDVADPLDVDALIDIVSVLPGGHKGTTGETIDTGAFTDKSQSRIWLDGVYRAINAGDLVILQAGSKFPFIVSPQPSRTQ